MIKSRSSGSSRWRPPSRLPPNRAEHHRHLEHGPAGRPCHSGRARPQTGRTQAHRHDRAADAERRQVAWRSKLSGEIADGAFTLVRDRRRGQGADHARHQRQAERRWLDGGHVRDARTRPRVHVVDGRAAERKEVATRATRLTHVYHRQTPVAPRGPQRTRRHRRAAVSRRDGARRPRGFAPPTPEDRARLHRDGARLRGQLADRRAKESLGAGGESAATSISRRRACARSAPFRDDLTIVSNTDVDPAEPFTATEIGGDHFRSSAVFLTQAHPKQTTGRRRAGRRLARSALRAAIRPGHADPVDAAVHRERRSGRRLRLRLLLRLHRRDQLGLADAAAADDARSARRLRHAVRRARAGDESPRRGASGWRSTAAFSTGCRRRRGACRRRSGPAIARASPTISTTCARSSGAFRTSRPSTAAASCANSRKRRLACPIRSPTTSS